MSRKIPRMKTRSGVRVSALAVLFLFLVVACSNAAQPATLTPAAIPVRPTSASKTDIYNAAWEIIRMNYIYERPANLDLEAIYDQYWGRLLAGDDLDETMDAMVAEFPENTISWQSRQARIEEEVASGDPIYEGIGAYISVRAEPAPHVVVLSILPNSPAEAAGLTARDSIYAIDGEPVSAEEGLSVVQRIRGEAGSTVTFSVQSPDGTRREVEVIRGQVTLTNKRVEAGPYEGTNILYVTFPRTGYAGLDLDLFTIYQAATQSGEVEGLILDLRISTTGTNWPLNTLLTAFTQGYLGETYTRTQRNQLNVQGRDFHGTQTLPLAILIGPDTHGLAEIFAASMQTNGRAVLFGLPTPGQIEGVSSYLLPDGSQLTLATVSFITAAGQDIGLQGVAPDVLIDAYWESQTPESDRVVKAAADWLLGVSE